MVDGVEYATLGEAIQAASQGGTIRLTENASNAGVPVAENSNLVLDLNGHTLSMTGPGTGSKGTETLGMQLLKGSTVIIKNGTITFNDELKMGIQNYSNLTLDNVKISGGPTITYVVSNNYGTTVFKNKTEITPTEGNVAFDCWYGLDNNGTYDIPGVFVIVADNTVKVNGKVEIGKQARATDENFAEHASITCPEDMELDVKILTPPCQWTSNGDGSKTLRFVLSDEDN